MALGSPDHPNCVRSGGRPAILTNLEIYYTCFYVYEKNIRKIYKYSLYLFITIFFVKEKLKKDKSFFLYKMRDNFINTIMILYENNDIRY